MVGGGGGWWGFLDLFFFPHPCFFACQVKSYYTLLCSIVLKSLRLSLSTDMNQFFYFIEAGLTHCLTSAHVFSSALLKLLFSAFKWKLF